MLEGRYHSLTGGRPFPKTTSTLKEVMCGAQPYFNPVGLSGGSGAAWGTCSAVAEVEDGDVFLSWSGSDFWDLTFCGY